MQNAILKEGYIPEMACGQEQQHCEKYRRGFFEISVLVGFSAQTRAGIGQK